MAQAQTKDKPGSASEEPTSAQLGTLASLVDQLGIEAPEVTTAAEAQSAIEDLQALVDKRGEQPAADDEPAPVDPSGPDDPEAAAAQPSDDDEVSAEETHRLFNKAVDAFGSALRVVFGMEELEVAQTPGIVGFVLPGFTEKLPHDNFTRCTTCNGYGKVLTGSIKAGDDERDCPDPRCKGRGFWQKAGPPEPAPIVGYTPSPVAANGTSEWGEAPAWMGDPNLTAPVTP